MSQSHSFIPSSARNGLKNLALATALVAALIGPSAVTAQDAPEPTVESSVDAESSSPGDTVTITLELAFDRDALLDLAGGDVVTYTSTLTVPAGIDADSIACDTGADTITCEVAMVDDETVVISGEAPVLSAGPGLDIEVELTVADDAEEGDLDITACTVVAVATPASATPGSAGGVASPVAGGPCEGAETEITVMVSGVAASPEPVIAATPEPAVIPSPEPTETPTPEPTATPEPTETPTPEPTETPTPEPTATPEPTETPTPEPTETPTPEPTETPTPEPTETPTPEPTETPTPEPTETPTPEPTETPTPEPTETPTPEPTETPTPEPTETPTPEPVFEAVVSEAVSVSEPAPGDTVDVTLDVSVDPASFEARSPDEPIPFTVSLAVPEGVTFDAVTCVLDEDATDIGCDAIAVDDSTIAISGEIPASATSPDTQVSIAFTVVDDAPEAELILNACTVVGGASTATPAAVAEMCEGEETDITFQVVQPTPTPEPMETPTPEPTATPEPTETPTPEPTATPEPTETPTPEPTATPEPTETPTPEPTETPEPTATPEPTETPTPEPTATPEPTETPTPEPTETPTPEPTPTVDLSGLVPTLTADTGTPGVVIELPSTGQGVATGDESGGAMLLIAATGLALAAASAIAIRIRRV